MDGLARWVQGQFLGAGHTAAALSSSQPAAGPSLDTSQPNAEGVTPFRYAPLKSSSHFRILRLKNVYVDASIPLNQHLHGSLVEASIESPPPYFALSYTWGDPALIESINIDGARLGITASCAAALRRMLYGKFERMIWVDSICINQGSDPEALAERSGQVAMMDLIYRSARQVNVHLGSGDAASDAACDALRKLSWWYLAAIIPSPLQGFFKRKYDRLADEVLGTSKRQTAEFVVTLSSGVAASSLARKPGVTPVINKYRVLTQDQNRQSRIRNAHMGNFMASFAFPGFVARGLRRRPSWAAKLYSTAENTS